MDTYEWPIVYLQTSTGCTHSCSICPHPIARPLVSPESISLETLGKVLEGAKDVPEFIVGLQGEPLQDSELFEKLKLISDTCPKAKITVETSGADLSIPMAVRLRDSGVNKVKVNVWDNPNPSRIRHFHYLGIDVEVVVVLNVARRFNAGRLKTLYGEQCKITEVPMNNGRGFVHDFVKLNNRELNEGTRPCSRPFQELCISATGNVVGCQEDYTSEKILGDATKESIDAIWNGKAFKEFRALHVLDDDKRTRALSKTICTECTFTR